MIIARYLTLDSFSANLPKRKSISIMGIQANHAILLCPCSRAILVKATPLQKYIVIASMSNNNDNAYIIAKLSGLAAQPSKPLNTPFSINCASFHIKIVSVYLNLLKEQATLKYSKLIKLLQYNYYRLSSRKRSIR